MTHCIICWQKTPTRSETPFISRFEGENTRDFILPGGERVGKGACIGPFKSQREAIQRLAALGAPAKNYRADAEGGEDS